MKSYKTYHQVRNDQKILEYQFIIKINLIPRFLHLEKDKMYRLLNKECDKLSWNPLDLILYRELNEDRRSNKFLPKGYRSFRFGYTHKNNIIGKYW